VSILIKNHLFASSNLMKITKLHQFFKKLDQIET